MAEPNEIVIRGPDGARNRFPADTSDEDIKAALAQVYPPEQKPGAGRATFLPIYETSPGKIEPAVPGLIAQPVEAFASALGKLKAGAQPREVAGEAYEAASAVQPGTSFAKPPLPKIPPAARKAAVAPEFDPSVQAGKFVSEALRADAKVPTGDTTGASAAAAAKAKIEAGGKVGQDVRTVDVGGEETRSLMRAAANYSPAGKEALKEVIDPRHKEQAVRMADWLRKSTGNPKEAHLVLDDIKEKARSPTSAAYVAAYEKGKDGISSPRLNLILSSDAFTPILKKAGGDHQRDLFAGLTKHDFEANGQVTMEGWDRIKREVDDHVTTAKRSGSNENARAWDTFRRQLLDELDRIVPEYAKARGSAAKSLGAGDAVEAGEKIAKSHMTKSEIEKIRQESIKSDPDDWGRVQAGFLDEYIRKFIFAPDRADLVKRLASSEGERQKLDAILGPKTAREFEAIVLTEEMLTKAKEALGNSTTSTQLQAMKRYAVEPQGVGGFAKRMAELDTTSVAALLFQWGKRNAQHAIEAKTEEQTRAVHQKVVEMLLTKDPTKYYAAIEELAKSDQAMGRIRQIANGIPRAPTSIDRQLPRALGAEGARQREQERARKDYLGPNQASLGKGLGGLGESIEPV